MGDGLSKILVPKAHPTDFGQKYDKILGSPNSQLTVNKSFKICLKYPISYKIAVRLIYVACAKGYKFSCMIDDASILYKWEGWKVFLISRHTHELQRRNTAVKWHVSR